MSLQADRKTESENSALQVIYWYPTLQVQAGLVGLL